MELNSGKALNIAPPNWKHSYAPLRDALNLHHGWARPDDPARARELTQAPERALEGFRLREGREGIHEYLTALVASESVTDRTSMVQAIREAGLEVTREGKDYLTVQVPANDERFRMKGRIYEKDWTYDRELDRAIATAAVQSDGRDRGIDLGRADAAREQLEATVRSRAAHHAERYQDTSTMMADELEIMRWTARWWWVALIVTWLVIGASQSGAGCSRRQGSRSSRRSWRTGRCFCSFPTGPNR